MKKNFFVKTNRYNWSFSSHKNSKTTLLSGIFRALKLRFSKNKNPFELGLQESENVKVVKLNDYNSLKKEVENYLSIGKFSSAPHSDQEPS